MMPDTLTDEQIEDTADALKSWLMRIGDIGKPGAESDDGVPYETVLISFTADELDKAVDSFKSSIQALQGSNGCYVRIFPELSFDGKKTYKLRARLAPKRTPVN